MNQKDRETQITRIRRYEELMHEAEEMLKEFSEEKADALKEKLTVLENYYTSPEWKQDFSDDEAGLLPIDIKRGVLSEDGIYNLIEKYREKTAEMSSGKVNSRKKTEATLEEKKRALFLHQKETLDTFLAHGTITRAQYDKSFGDLVKKMGMEGIN